MAIHLQATKHLGCFDLLDIYMCSPTAQFQTLVCPNQKNEQGNWSTRITTLPLTFSPQNLIRSELENVFSLIWQSPIKAVTWDTASTRQELPFFFFFFCLWSNESNWPKFPWGHLKMKRINRQTNNPKQIEIHTVLSNLSHYSDSFSSASLCSITMKHNQSNHLFNFAM